MKATWKPADGTSSAPDNQSNLPESAFAFPGKRKEPITDASHVRNAIARFDQVKDVSDADRDQAFANLKAAAKHFKVTLTETSWHDLGNKPHTPNKAAKKTAKKQQRRAQRNSFKLFSVLLCATLCTLCSFFALKKPLPSLLSQLRPTNV